VGILKRRKFCKCGCKQQIISKRKGVEFIWGHHNKCLSDEVIQKRTNSIKKSYEHRDGYWKGKKRSVESVMKTAEANRGRKYKKHRLLRRKMCACGCNKLFFSKRKEVMCIKGHVSPETRKKLSLVHIGSFKKGRVSWNKGLTKDDPRVKKNAEASGATQKRKWKEDLEYREKMFIMVSERHKKLWSDPEYREHMSEVHKGHVHSENQKRKIGDSIKNSIAYKEANEGRVEKLRRIWEDPDYREKLSKAQLKNWEKAGPERRKQASQTIKNTIASIGIENWMSRIMIPSSLELKIQEQAKKCGFAFYDNHMIGPYFADLYFPNYKTVVECDGKYWHNLPGAWMKDGRRDFWFRKNGYKVIRLKEDEINECPELAFNRAINAMMGVGSI